MSYNGKGGQNPQRGHGRGTGSSGGRGSGDSGHSYRGTPAGGSGCFNCGGSGHICRDCPNSGGGGSAFRGGRGGRGGGLGGGQRGGRGGFHDEIKGPINNPRPIDIPSFPILFQPEKTVQLPSADVEKLETALVTRTMQSKFAELSLEGDVKLPRRPGYGKTGKPIELRTNYFEMKPKEDVQFYRWQIKIHEAESKKAWDTPAPGSEPTPGDKPTPKQKIRRVIELFLQSPYLAKFRPRVASDYQAMLITTEKLDFKGQEFGEYALVYSGEELLDPASDRGLRLTISVRADGVIGVRQLLKYLTSTNIQERCDDKANLLQVLNIIMAQKPSNDPSIASFTRSNKFFPLSAYLGDLGGGIGAFRGYYSSARTATGRLLLNVNSVTSAFYHDVSLNDLIRAYMQGDQEGRRINGFLKGLRVKVSHLPKDKKRPRKIRTVSAVSYQQGSEPPVFDNPMTVKFEKGGKFITVKEHFAKEHNITRLQPSGYVVNLGNADHKSWVPAELCEVLPGQQFSGKLGSTQTALMLKKANRAPGDNAALIVDEGARLLGLKPHQASGPDGFGLNITPQMITVRGRVLQPPTPMYANGKAADVDVKGSWNMKDLKFLDGRRLENWSYFRIKFKNFNDHILSDTNFRALAHEFSKAMSSYGMPNTPICPPKEIELELDRHRPETFQKAFEGIMERVKTKNIRFLWVILPEKNIPLYSKLKYVADYLHGIHTVCSVGSKLNQEKQRAMYFANEALKWNLKLGGQNLQLKPNSLGIVDQGRTMLVGIDVTHPGSQSVPQTPSIAGVVASVDKQCAQWPASIRAQGNRQEMVEHLREMMKERLRAWQAKNRALPENIIVYRDGVSEGQYAIVLEQEYADIDRAITDVYLGGTKKPKVAIFIVGKRHHTRFYPTREEDMADKKGNGNPQRGTVVDRGITSERQWDFYLQAHHGLQGTARPAHYVAIKDQIKFTQDDLEKLTNNLCYLWGRSTKAVSICPPAKLADLVCERGRCYLHEALTNPTNETADFDWNRSPWSEGVHANLKNSMFYI